MFELTLCLNFERQKYISDFYKSISPNIKNEAGIIIKHNSGGKSYLSVAVPDEKKDGGSYQTLVGIKRIRETEQELLMYDGTVIPMPQIISIKNV